MLNTLSTVTFDPSGYIELDVTPQTTQGASTRRVNRVATLDGGVVVNDAGFAEGDRTLDIAWVPTDSAVEAAIERVMATYQTLQVSVRGGVYLAAQESYTPGERESKLRLLVISKLSA